MAPEEEIEDEKWKSLINKIKEGNKLSNKNVEEQRMEKESIKNVKIVHFKAPFVGKR